MGHEFDSGFFGNRQPAWHGLGNVITADRIKAAEAVVEAGLGWYVEKIPLLGVVTLPSGEELEIDVPSHRATVRLDRVGQGPLGVVGADYAVLQNEELLEFCEMLQDTDEATIHTAGSLRGGRVVWVCAKIATGVQVAGAEELVEIYLMITNAHDGSRAVTAVITPVRTVCMNTLNLAISRAIRAWTVRHTPGMRWKLQDAREALGITFTYVQQFERASKILLKQKINQREMRAFLETLVPYTEVMLESIVAGEPSRAARNVAETREMIFALSRESPNLQNVKGTKWGALNAVAEYVDFGRPQRNVFMEDEVTLDERTMQERRFVRVAIQNELKQQALRLLDPSLSHGRGENLSVLAGLK